MFQRVFVCVHTASDLVTNDNTSCSLISAGAYLRGHSAHSDSQRESAATTALAAGSPVLPQQSPDAAVSHLSARHSLAASRPKSSFSNETEIGEHVGLIFACLE